MTTPRPQLSDGERIVQTVQGLRKKGIFGNYFGEMHVTDRRVVFVKSIMKSGLISAAMNAKGAKPKLSFDLGAITGAAKLPKKKLFALTLTVGTETEIFLMSEADIDSLVVRLGK